MHDNPAIDLFIYLSIGALGATVLILLAFWLVEWKRRRKKFPLKAAEEIHDWPDIDDKWLHPFDQLTKQQDAEDLTHQQIDREALPFITYDEAGTFNPNDVKEIQKHMKNLKDGSPMFINSRSGRMSTISIKKSENE